MKKIMILLLCTFSLPSFCQINQISISGGVGAAKIFGGESWKDPIGAQVTIETKLIEVTNKSELDIGLGISFQGAVWEAGQSSGKVTLSYLTVPITYKLSGDNGLYLELGLQPAFLLGANDHFNGNKTDYKDNVKKFDLGLPVGAGYEVNEKIEVGLRATYGITNLNNTGSDVADHNFIVVALGHYTINTKK